MRFATLSTALVCGGLLCSFAYGQQARWPDESDTSASGYTIGTWDDSKAPGVKADAKEPAKENGNDEAKEYGNGDKKNGNGDGCCKKNGKKKKKKCGCCGNGCGANGCAEEEEEEEECKCYCYLFGPEEAVSFWDEMWGEDECCKPGFKVGGWLNAGYHNKPEPLSFATGDLGSFNDVPHKLHMRQAWLYAERTVDTSEKCTDWGFRVDVLYGTDAQKTQAFGNPPGPARGWDNQWDNGVYGWALPQAYFDVAYGDLTVHIGKWFTKHGYETVQSTGNFFFSRILTFYNSEPFTHTGVMSEYKVNDELTVMNGWTLGWDTGFDQFANGNMYHGGFVSQLTEDVKFTYVNCTGDFGARGKNAHLHTMMLDVKLSDKWNYVVQNDILHIGESPTGVQFNESDTGLINYLFYTHNDCWKFGVRGEWWKNDDVVNNTGTSSWYVVTYGANYKPHANLVIRPEMRHTWSPATDVRVDNFGVDAIFTW